MENPGKLVT